MGRFAAIFAVLVLLILMSGYSCCLVRPSARIALAWFDSLPIIVACLIAIKEREPRSPKGCLCIPALRLARTYGQ